MSSILAGGRPPSHFHRLHQIFMQKRAAIDTCGQVLWNFFLLFSGSVVCAIAINGILIPHEFLSGGFVGLCLITHYLFPALPLSWLYFLLNIPVYILGCMFVGRRFLLYSLAGLVFFSIAVDVIQVTIPVHDNMLAAILAGIISGVGCGIILKSLGTAGGLDIFSIILAKKYSIRLGHSVLAMNGLILCFAAVRLSLEGALYTLIFIFVSTQVLNVVVYGLSQRKAVYIVSPQWHVIRQELRENIRRGVTILDGKGGFSDQEIQMLFTVITHQELPRLKKVISNVDPDAFVVVSDTLEVMGNRIGNQPRW